MFLGQRRGCVFIHPTLTLVVRTTEVRVPADPASPDSKSEVTPQAGQVWFPNSSFKTAQAIKDFNQEKLPLIVFANWRGFSGTPTHPLCPHSLL